MFGFSEKSRALAIPIKSLFDSLHIHALSLRQLSWMPKIMYIYTYE